MGENPRVEILLKDQPAAIFIDRNPETSFKLDPWKPIDIEGLCKLWAPGVYIHYSDRQYNIHAPASENPDKDSTNNGNGRLKDERD
jgi:hypothetical protein